MKSEVSSNCILHPLNDTIHVAGHFGRIDVRNFLRTRITVLNAHRAHGWIVLVVSDLFPPLEESAVVVVDPQPVFSLAILITVGHQATTLASLVAPASVSWKEVDISFIQIL